MIKNIYVFGATSTIAQETLKNFAKEGCNMFLVGRNNEKLAIVKNEMKSYGADKVEIFEADATDWSKHRESINKAVDTLGVLDLIFVAHGTLPDNEKTRKDPELIRREFDINCTSVMSICSIASDYFEAKGSGNIAVISSVAGERGRQSNFIYGSAKGAVSLYLQGLRNALYKKNIKVITIKPGMVDTPMTEDFDKGLLFASSKSVGKGIYKAIINGKDVVYIPSIWKWIMRIIKIIPESIFKKLSL